MKMFEIQVDGKLTKAPPGATVLSVLSGQGIKIPTLCYHPDLSPARHCRLCVVELEGRGLVASCHTEIAPGMKILTDSPLVQRSRRATLELILANHPMDCIVCAKNGKCGLQDAAAFIGVDAARVKLMRTGVPELPIDESNPFFVRDPNRCVICGICVRTCSELQGIGAIGMVETGVHAQIATGTQERIVDSRCQSCGECVTRCPTGALHVRGAKEPSHEVLTTCTFCGVGCGLHLGVRGNEVVSARGDRDNPANEGALCVKGRFGYSFVNSPERLQKPLIKRNGRAGKFEEVSWDEALDFVADRFKQYSGDQFAGISSSRSTNEENYIMQKFVRSVMGTNNVDNCARLCHAPTVSGLSKSFGTGGGTNPISDLDGAACVMVVGSNATEAHAVVGARLRRTARKSKVIVVDPRRIELVEHSDLWLPIRPGTDVALFMGMAKIILDEKLEDSSFIAARCEGFEPFVRAAQEFPLEEVSRITGVEKERILAATRLFATTKPAMIIWSLGITEHTHGTDNVRALANLLMLTGNIGKPSAGAMPMRGQNNVQGACDMGCVPSSYSGSQPVDKPEVKEKFERSWGVKLSGSPGLTVVEMLQAAERKQVKALYIMGMDVAFSVADTKRTQKALQTAEFLVCQDIFLTGTAKFADVVLPAASFAEKDGTFTNLERRVQLVRKTVEPVGESKPDWWIVAEIARRMGAKGFDYQDAAEIMREMGSLTPSFSGISFDRLEKGGIQWPCTAAGHPGTERLHVDKFNTSTGKGRFAALAFRAPFEAADEEYPIILNTGRGLYHFHLAMTSQVEGLMKLHPEELVWIHPADAQKLGVGDGAPVRVVSRRGELVVRAHITDQVQLGQAFMTFHFYDQPTNVLTHQELDPVSKTPEFKITAVRIEKAERSSGAV